MGDAAWHVRSAVADDLDELVALVNRSAQYDGVARVMARDELAEELDGSTVTMAEDVRVAVAESGVVLGYVYTFHLPSESREERCYVFGVVDPPARGRGIGRALLAWGVAHGSAQLRSSGRSLPRYLRVDAYDHQQADLRLFEVAGFTEERCIEELLRTLDPHDPSPSIGADGSTSVGPRSESSGAVRIVPWPPDRDEEIRLAKNEAFADHWGSAPTSPASWHTLVRGFGAWPEQSFVALDADGTVIGHCLNHRYEADDAVTGRRAAVIDSVGVRRPWRGLGVASAMIERSLHAFAAAGCTHAVIEVDSENPSGAARLYRSLGFELEHRSITYQLAVD